MITIKEIREVSTKIPSLELYLEKLILELEAENKVNNFAGPLEFEIRGYTIRLYLSKYFKK